MKDSELARLFEAMHGPGPRPGAKNAQNAARRLVFSEDGLTLVKHFSGCLQGGVNAFSNVSIEYLEGRRSVLLEIINLALRQEEGNEDG